MHLKNKRWRTIIATIIALFVIFIIYKGRETYNAHNTFEGYCTRRGLVIEHTGTDYGYCKNLTTNKEFKIVLFKGRRFLDGDLPCGFLCF